ncbi:MAG: sugar ABC transporter ATP-binding protein [Phycisphaerae bacterium]|nr:sugar ABC transporter ATP-binding protein [Phycisphaerae bacterium]
MNRRGRDRQPESARGSRPYEGLQAVEVLSLSHISFSFGAIEALRSVSLSVRGPALIGLVGDNGSGKTTLLRLLSGELRPNSGVVKMLGEQRFFRRPADAIRAGVAFVPQDDAVCADLSIAENLMLGQEAITRILGIPFIRRAACKHTAKQTLSLLRKDFPSVTRLAMRLSGGERKVLAIAKALLRYPKILLLDEPTNSLGSHQRTTFFENLRKEVERGVTVIFSTHRLNELREVATSVIALRQGRLAAVQSIGDLTDAELLQLLSGAEG